MRSFLLALLAFVCAQPVAAQQGAPAARAAIADVLPLFAKNGCADVRDPAEQLFCGDPDLNGLVGRLSKAVEGRLSRLPDRRLAVEENVEWIRNRNASCGILSRMPIQPAAFAAIKACLLKVTEQRIAILADDNFDCLAANTTASLVICADPGLAEADRELNSQMVALFRKLKEDETRSALAEYARWIRTRDRICELDDKDNVPLSELESAGPCLSDMMKQKLAEIAAAKGDPRRFFGKDMQSPTPDADAVDICVGRIHASNTCENFLRVSRVLQLDIEASEKEAIVTAAVEMKVMTPFGVCSPIASNCSGACWDLKAPQPKQAITPSREIVSNREIVPIGHRLTVEKSFTFQKNSDGSWRCTTPALRPVEFGTAQSGP